MQVSLKRSALPVDRSSANALRQVSNEEAKRIVAALGPNVHNSSAYVTKSVKEIHRGCSGQQEQVMGKSKPPMVVKVKAKVVECPVTVYSNGQELTFDWISKEQAAQTLLAEGILDARSAEYLTMASPQAAWEAVECLTAECRNASAVVTKRLRNLGTGGAAYDAQKPIVIAAEPVEFYWKGELMDVNWTSTEQVCADLFESGVLDEYSADFLKKGSEDDVRRILNNMGKDVRNPSGYVTAEMKKIRGQGNTSAWARVETMQIAANGQEFLIECHSITSVLEDLVRLHVLDQRSSDLLSKIPEKNAYEVISGINANIKNPSGYVTKKALPYLTSW